MYQKILDDKNAVIGIFNTDNNAQIPIDNDNRDYQQCMKWLTENNITIDDLAQHNPPDNNTIRIQYSTALQLHIDKTAQTKDYANGDSCAGYASSTNLTWKTEALAFITWRDNVWSYAYQVYSDVNNGAQLPTLNDFIANAPVISW